LSATQSFLTLTKTPNSTGQPSENKLGNLGFIVGASFAALVSLTALLGLAIFVGRKKKEAESVLQTVPDQDEGVPHKVDG
jgi:hypothetical protein